MDVPRLPWKDLAAKAEDRAAWKADVNKLKAVAQRTTKPQKKSVKTKTVRPNAKRSRFVLYTNKAQRDEAAVTLADDNPFKNAT